MANHEHNHSHEGHEHEGHTHSEGESQELMLKASLIERHLNEMGERMNYISQQLSELEDFNSDMKFMKDTKGKEVFSALGRGIYVKSPSKDNSLFVNVGSGVVVKKTPEETVKIIETQIKGFHEAKNSLMTQMEIYKSMMNQTIASLEAIKKTK